VGDLLKSSAELLGQGCVGTTFKILMDGGDDVVVVVVKRVVRGTVWGGATLKGGCAVAHPDFLKNQRNFFFFNIDVLNLNKIVNTLK
jgi:hypothetical protein